MDIEITGYRVLYSESIAGRGVARLKVGWAQQGQLTALIEYLTVNQSLSILYWQGTANFCLGPPWL